jgi:hypothetical protein
VLEEMPPFPEKESSGLLNLLKKKRPGRVPDNPEIKLSDDGGESVKKSSVGHIDVGMGGGGGGGGSADLLGLGIDSGATSVNGNGSLVGIEPPTDNLKK